MEDESIRVTAAVLDSLVNLVGDLVVTRNQLLEMMRGEDESKYAAPIVHLDRVTSDIQDLFLPAFSTARKDSPIFDCGEGMDLARTQGERIGGSVDRIPLTLAIIPALLVESGGLTFAIPQLGIVELVRLAAEDTHNIETIHETEVFRLHNRLLPLVHLDKLLGLSHVRSSGQDVHIVVVQVGSDQFGLIVSEVFGTQEIVVKRLGNLLRGNEIYQGTTILGNGRVIMILDVAGIASQFGGQIESSREREQQRADPEADADGLTTSLLLFEAGDAGNMAVPLALVSRLEEFPRSRIEKMGDKLLVQYRGDLLPLLPLSLRNGEGAPDPQPVIVFSEGERSMGLMVDRIQDIVEDRVSIRIQSHRPGVLGTALIAGRATAILDTNHYVAAANPAWSCAQYEGAGARERSA